MSKLISKDDFIKLFDNYDITISDSDYSRFEAYADLLCEWNEKINLTAITDPEGISIKHFFDSVYPFTLFEVKENATVIAPAILGFLVSADTFPNLSRVILP